MVISMTTNLFPLPYWAPAFQRVPLFLRPLGETYALKERRRAREDDKQARKDEKRARKRAKPTREEKRQARKDEKRADKQSRAGEKQARKDERRRARRPRRQWGGDRRTRALPVVARPATARSLSSARFGIFVTVVAWLAYIVTTLSKAFFDGEFSLRFAFDALLYIVIVTLLVASALAYLLARVGFL